MPCNYSEYHPKWTLIRLLIRKRAAECCEKCGVPNRSIIYRPKKGLPDWKLMPEAHEADAMGLDGVKFTKIILTIAHLDRDKTNNRFNNLAALCQRCHLKHDIKQHVANRRYGRNHKSKHQLRIEL